MKTFKTFLTERIQKNDIIDLYIIMTMPEPAEDDNKYNAQQILQNAKANVIKEVETILLKELRHGIDMVKFWRYYEGEKDKPTKAGEKLAHDLFGINMPFDALYNKLHKSFVILQNKLGNEDKEKDKELNISELAQLSGLPWTINSVINAFEKLPWDVGYGGKSWGTIAREVKKLTDSTPGELVKNIDRFVDYVHNTGPVLNKFKGGNEGWLLYLLDLKQHTTNIKDLIPYASYDVRKLFGDIMWRDFTMKQGFKGAEDSNNVPLITRLVKKYIADSSKNKGSTKDQQIATLIYTINRQPYDAAKKIITSLDSETREKLKKLTLSDVDQIRELGLDQKEIEKYAETHINIITDEDIELFTKSIKEMMKTTNYHYQFNVLHDFTTELEDKIFNIMYEVGLDRQQDNIINRAADRVIALLKPFGDANVKAMLNRASALIKTRGLNDTYLLERIIKRYA